MPRNASILCPAETWTQLTSHDATAVTVQVLGMGDVYLIRGTAVAPTSLDGAILCMFKEGLENQALSSIWPGASGNRLWAFARNSANNVFVSHA